MNEWVSAARITTKKGDEVVAWRRENGVLRMEKHAPEWVTYHKRGEIEQQRDLLRSIHIRNRRTEGEWVRIAWADEGVRRLMCKRDSVFAASGVGVYEGDVGPIRRIITDRDIRIQKPARAYIDLETDSRVPLSRKEEMRILSWAVVGVPAGQTESVSRVQVLREDTDAAERDLIQSLFVWLRDFDQVLAWNGDGFDFPVLTTRALELGAVTPLEIERLVWLDQMALFKRMNVASESGEEKESYALNAVAKHLLGEGKLDFDASKTWEAWAAGDAERERMAKYNVQDTALLPRIEEKTGFLDLFQSVCDVCRLFPESKSLHPTFQMDGYMLRLGLERGVHFTTKVFREGAEDQFAGAYVMPPQANGIMKNVHVADFAALYPSIILTWNMSPETKGAKRKLRDHVPEGFSWSPLTHFTFATGIDGILPTALRELIRLRKTWNDTKASRPPGTDEWKDADRKSTAYKVIANSFYGCLGNRGSRYYDREIAESVTQCGKWLILKTIEAGRRRTRELNTIYADTDSCFVTGCDESEFGEFVKQCNAELYPRILQEVGCAANEIKLAYEKEFERLVICSAKKYAGRFAHYKGKRAAVDSKPEIKGLEYKRGDAALLARTLQLRVINELMAGEENPEKFRAAVEDMLRHVMHDLLPMEEIRFSKSISKPLKEYAEKTKKDGTAQSAPEHVRVARELEKRGIPVAEGTRVAYYVFDGSDGVQVAPIEDLCDEKPVDRYYMWDAKIFPPTQRLLQAAFPHYPWEDQYANQRPQKRHEGQLGLFRGGPVRIAPRAVKEAIEESIEDNAELMQRLADRPIVRVVVDESRNWADVLARAIGLAPGESTLVVTVRFDNGREAVLDVPAKVDANRFEDAFFEAGFLLAGAMG